VWKQNTPLQAEDDGVIGTLSKLFGPESVDRRPKCRGYIHLGVAKVRCLPHESANQPYPHSRVT
jgi:hypothetical protein